MKKFERLNSEEEVLNHLENLVSQGVNENDVKVVSKYRIEEVSARFPDVDFKDSEGGIMDKIAALFSDEEPEDKMLNSMALTDEERDECRQAIDQGQFIVFNAHNDFDGALDGDRFDMSQDSGQDGLNNTQKTEATMAGAQFGAHDAGREPGFNERDIEDEIRDDVGYKPGLDNRDVEDDTRDDLAREKGINDRDIEEEVREDSVRENVMREGSVRDDAVNNTQPDEDSLDPMGPEKNSAPRENAFNDDESHDVDDDEYLKERKDDEEFSTERLDEGMDTDNERNKNYAFGKDHPYDQVSELDQDKDDNNMNSMNENNDEMNSTNTFRNGDAFSEEDRMDANNEEISEKDRENHDVAREQNNSAIDGFIRDKENQNTAREQNNSAIDGVERRTVNADRRSEDYDPLLDDNHASDETRSEDNVPDRDERVEELSREPYNDDDERLKNEQDVDREVRRTEDMDYDDDDHGEKRSSDLGDSLRADDAREDAFDHDKGRF